MQSGMVIIAGILVYYFRGHEKAHHFHDVQSPDVLGYLNLLQVPVSALTFQGTLFGVLGFVVSSSFFITVDPILPYKLSSEFGYNQQQIGIFFFHYTSVVVVLSFFLLLIPDSRYKVLLVAFGCFISAVGAFLTGPSKLLGFPNSIKLTTAGMVASGIAKSLIQSFVFTYVLKEAETAY